MAGISKQIKWITTPLSLIATYLPNVWALILGAGATTALGVWMGGISFIEKPSTQAIALTFLAVLWTFVALVMIYDRQRPIEVFPRKDFPYALTFENIFANFTPHKEDNTLQLAIQLTNYSSYPLRYSVEHFVVKIDSRTIDSENAPPIFLSRGAKRIYFNPGLKFAHVKEFLGTNQEGTVHFSIAYGDVAAPNSRRLKMSFKTYYHFPPDQALDPLNATKSKEASSSFEFSHVIVSESDEAID